MRRRQVTAADGDLTPAGDLVRFPWDPADADRVENFTQWLVRRQRWRDTHSTPLPGLYSRDRHALSVLPIPADLAAGETANSSKAGQARG